ncbi:unnamed protein product [Pleuronectes platessa]|uniref:Ig-like domain-containing protein n=1 Tax=Pleuronectes platessa TaxID=8262 RepID=A0A9N7VXH8_PLEPL|nr:unnamed protein product [Pleuronectes platessa]
MDQLHVLIILLVGSVSSSQVHVSGSVLNLTVSPGDNATLYCDCKPSTGLPPFSPLSCRPVWSITSVGEQLKNHRSTRKDLIPVIAQEEIRTETCVTLHWKSDSPHRDQRGRKHRVLNSAPILTSTHAGGLWNCQSANRRTDFISGFATQQSLDFVVSLSLGSHRTTHPPAFSFTHTPRPTGKDSPTLNLTINFDNCVNPHSDC